MSYPGGNPNYGFAPAQASAPYGSAFGAPSYPPAPGALPYPPSSSGSAPYPPAPGGSPYPPNPAGLPYPPASSSHYPPSTAGFSYSQNSSPYPPAPASSPYPPAPASSPYPPAPASSPYPPAPASSHYPPAPASSHYPPAPASSPYPPAPASSPYAPASSPYAPAPASSPYAPASSPYAPASVSSYAPTLGSSPYPSGPNSTPYPPAPGNSQHPPNTGSLYPNLQGNPYPSSGGYPAANEQRIAPSYAPQTNSQVRTSPGYPGAGSNYGNNPAYPGVSSGVPAGYRPGGSVTAYRETPTVRSQARIDPSNDAAVLRKAMKGLGTDEASIIGVLGRRTSDERQQILLKYQQSYGRDLVKDLKSELGGRFKDTVVALMTSLPVYLARELHRSMQGLGTNEKTLVEILCTRDNASLMVIKNAYYHEFRRKLEDDIRGDTSGDFGRLLISMCACSRDEVQCDRALAKSLAQQLYQAGEGKFGTDESEFNRILASYSYPQLRCVFEEYKMMKGRSFGDALKSELSGDLKIGMKAVYQSIENRAAFFARELHNSMSGLGTTDSTLIRIVVTRSEIDMVNIKQEYQKLFNRSLEKDIRDDTSGDYKKILLALVEG